ncbi:hypothetical protein EV126DRAFT_379606 [Verticillium dahliae]|nr:hypothetical protein EV126DRAFT_379606 [Verticillium dahliae]
MNWQDELAGQLLSVMYIPWSAPELPTDMPEILRIHGRPGFGKTFLCSRIVEHLSAISVKFVAYFFLSSDHESRNDPYAVVRSWLSQPAAQPDVIRSPRATVVQFLRDVLQARPGCVLVVDGLNECTAPADSSSFITRFLEDDKNANTPATRVVVNCRDESEIRQTLRANDSYSLAEYQISPRDVHDDASTFSRSIVDKKLAKKPEDIRASLSKTMTDRSDGQFLWLLLQEQSLKSWKTLVQLQRGLDSTPAGLNNLAAFALRPLTLGEITEAVLIDEEYEGLPTDELPDVIDDDYISSEIVELCGPLVEVRGPRPAAGARSGVPLDHVPGTLECVLSFMNEDDPCWGACRNWVDTHDDDEVHAAEDEDVPPGPSYYALKFGLTALAVTHVRKFGTGRSTASTGQYLLDLCCTQGNVELAEMILEVGVDIETKAGGGRTPLYSGSRHDQSKIVRALLLRSARVGKMNPNGATPVNAAASNGLVKVVRFLVEKGAEISIASNNGFTPANATDTATLASGALQFGE